MDEASAWEVLASEAGRASLRPSWLEMLAQQQLMQLLRPALGWIVEVLAVRTSETRGVPSGISNIIQKLLQNQTEVFHICVYLLEDHYLRHYHSSFSENFYGLHREVDPSSSSSSSSSSLSLGINRTAHNTSLFFLVVIPYLKAKLDDYYRSVSRSNLGEAGNEGGGGEDEFSFLIASPQQQQQGQQQQQQGQQGQQQTNGFSIWKFFAFFRRIFVYLKRTFPKWYPFVHALYDGLFFYYQLIYLYRPSKYYSPDMHFQKILTKRTTPKKMEYFEKVRAAKRELFQRRVLMSRAPMRYLLTALFYLGGFYEGIFDSMRVTLPLAVFFIQFLRWWYSNDRHSHVKEAPPPPPPPASLDPAPSIQLPVDKTLCPICRASRTNPALSVSGYAFCYPCLFDYVTEHGQCPVTLLPMDPSQIRKIYEAA